MSGSELVAEYRAAQKAHGDRNWHRDYPSMISKTRQRLDAAVRALMAEAALRGRDLEWGERYSALAASLLPEDESDE